MPLIYTFFILNKSGSLIYFKNYFDDKERKQNQYIQLTSTFFGLDAIAAHLSPNEESGPIELLEADNYKLHCLTTPIGAKVSSTFVFVHSHCVCGF